MSNLSDLLPAGGGAKVITATASGNLATGQTVALQSDGTVIAISSTASGFGSEVVFESATTEVIATTYDTTNDKVVIAYRDAGNSDYGTAVVGTLSGKTISFGTPVVFESATVSHIGIGFDSTNGKAVIAYRDHGNGNYGTAIVGTVSGTSISFGSAVVFESATVEYCNVAFDSTNGKIVVAYVDAGDSDKGKAVVGTVSGTSISFGSIATFNNATTKYAPITFDSNAGKVVIAFRDSGNSNYGTAIVGTVSGASISFGSEAVFESATSEYMGIGFDSTSNKVVVGYSDDGNSAYATAVVGTVSGTSISFGTPVVAASSNSEYINVVHNVSANNMFYTFMSITNSNYGAYLIGTVSGTSISFTSIAYFNSARSDYIVPVYDPDQEAVAIAYSDNGNSSYGTAIVYQDVTTNSNNFVGITNQAINNSASGEVVVEGGVITNGSLLPPLTTASYGSEVVFEAGYMRYPAIVYDTANDKIVIAYADYGDSNKGKAIVGTVSGTSISYGSAVEFNSGSTDYVTAVFDASAGKVVIGYRDVGNSNYGTAIVGTVSGTSISFGTEVVFESAEAMYVEASYDANAQKTLFVYQDNGNSGYLTAQVGTVSGTSISFGGASALNNDSSVYIAIAYDSTANKHVVFFANGDNSNRGDACVVTISGTSMSVGSFTTGVAANALRTAVAYDANANKSVIFFSDADNSNIGKAIIGTVSGTSISVGTAVTFNSGGATAFHGTPAFYDSTTNKVIIGYNDSSDSNKGKTKIGTVDGNTITFGDAVVFNSTSTSGGEIAITKDTDNTKLVIAYRDSGNSNYGTAVVGTLSTGVPNFTLNSTYYVQDDGTLSTTSSSVTAGKAIANTTLLLKG